MDFAILGTHSGQVIIFLCFPSIFQQTQEPCPKWDSRLLHDLKYLLTFILGYEIQGAENLPANGPALIIYYHGAIPIDIYYFLAKIYLTRNRIVHTVADHFLFKIPGKNTRIM